MAWAKPEGVHLITSQRTRANEANLFSQKNP